MSQVKQADKAQYEEAVLAMKRGDRKARTRVAFYKLSGRGAAIDRDGALALLKERAKKKDGEAMWILGICYEYGIGTMHDIERAESLYRRSAQTGDVVGKFLFKNRLGGRGTGVMILDGSGKHRTGL